MAGEDIVAGCVRWLRADVFIAAIVAADDGGAPLIVADVVPERAEFAGGVCIVVSYVGPAAGNDHNTYEQVRLQVEMWSDSGRDAQGMLQAPAAGRQRLVAVYHAVDRRLHRPQGGVQQWGAITTTDATRLAGLTPYPVPGGDGLWRGTAYYGVGLA